MKQWRVFTQRQAKEDTNDIWCYIAQDNPKAEEYQTGRLRAADRLMRPH